MKPWPKWYTPPTPKYMPLHSMLIIVARHYGVTVGELKGSGRNKDLVNGRAVIARHLRERGNSFPAIARMIGRSDHTTAMNLVETFDRRSQRYPEMAMLYLAIALGAAEAA